MRFSAPVFRLKRRARLLSRSASIPLHQALDQVARAEGAGSWSALAARLAADRPAPRIIGQLRPGDLLLLAARPGQGKTMLALELLLEVARRGQMTCFFTLDWSASEAQARLMSLRQEGGAIPDGILIDASDGISADHVISRMGDAKPGSLAIIDYMQLLDQDRRKPEIAVQIEALRSFAAQTGVIFVLLSQIDRSWDAARKPFPDMADVRLPNPVPFSAFARACFLHDGEIRLDVASA
ncbi:MAG: replicative DNA helicase [Minwuia thermotolerans]|nr:MAG: replicative DNA helicase [Minwuia thermotolerans]